MLTNTATRYGAAARFFHWSIALLILIDIALGLWGKFTPRNAETVDFLQMLYSSHKTIGMAVLAPGSAAGDLGLSSAAPSGAAP